MSSVGLPGRSGVGAPLPNPTGQSPRAAVPVSNARAEASRRNGAKSRGPKTPEGKARAAQNALKHGMRAQKYLVLPEEDADEFAGLEAAFIAELAPVGALQTVLARRVAVAAWRLARADRIETDLFAERSYGADAGPGLALIRDGNGTRSFETLLRYRGAAMVEFWRALKTLKALQAEPALAARGVLAAEPLSTAPRPPLAWQPNEPERCGERLLERVLPEPPVPGRALHEAAAPPPRCPEPNEPDSPSHRRQSGQSGERATPSGSPCGRDPHPMPVSAAAAAYVRGARASEPGAGSPTRRAHLPRPL